MKKRLSAGIIMAALFAAFTYLVTTYDIAAVGPQGTEVGFSHINSRFHEMTGVNMGWYEVTDVLGYAAIALAALFAVAGLVQMIRRRSLLKVDREIISLGVLFVAVIAFYVGFEKFIINYRPVIMPGEIYPEASYPSSHTMLVCAVMGAAMILTGRYIRSRFLAGLLRVLFAAVMVMTVCGRLYCGVHWLTDIIGGLLLSAALLLLFSAAVYRKTDRAEQGYTARH